MRRHDGTSRTLLFRNHWILKFIQTIVFWHDEQTMASVSPTNHQTSAQTIELFREHWTVECYYDKFKLLCHIYTIKPCLL